MLEDFCGPRAVAEGPAETRNAHPNRGTRLLRFERGEPFLLCELPLKSHVLFNQAAVFNRNRDLTRQHAEHRSRIGRQTATWTINQQHSGRTVLTAERISKSVRVSSQGRVAFNRRPVVRSRDLQQLINPRR